MENKEKPSVGTIARTLALTLVLINQTLIASGKNPLPFSEETIYEWLSLTLTIVVSITAWWKNNSFTKNAIILDKCLSDMKTQNHVSSDKNDK